MQRKSKSNLRARVANFHAALDRAVDVPHFSNPNDND
jgi:hypothetical protein